MVKAKDLLKKTIENIIIFGGIVNMGLLLFICFKSIIKIVYDRIKRII